jgi:hypothetical protein
MGDRRLTVIEIALLVGIAAMIFVIARPGVLRSRTAVNEQEAIGALRTLATVETHYNTRHPAAGFTCSLSELAKDGLIDAQIASGTRSGYRLTSAGCRTGDPKTKANVEFQWFADPVSAEMGTRHFCVDQSKVLRASDTSSGQGCLVMGSEL